MKTALFGRAAIACALAALLSFAGVSAAWAAQTGWTVSFTGDEMPSNGTHNIAAEVANMQPGGEATFDIALSNDIDGEADWYMRNEVLKTMEEAARNNSGGSYTYRLTYTNPAGQTETILTNDVVSGDASEGANGAKKTEGLFDATTATGDWFYLDRLGAHEKATVELYVAIDPESHGNTYFDTSAQLQIAFAVEPVAEVPANPNAPQTTQVNLPLAQTGDTLAWGLLALAAGAAFAVVLFARLRQMRNEKGNDHGVR